jgi:hypothetical protein
VQLIFGTSLVPNPADNNKYFWDLINPSARFLLLNQTQVSSIPFYNVTSQLQQNVSNLNWVALPADVQSFLLGQSPAALLNLTYLQWGWVDLSNTFASTTLFSLLSVKQQNSLPNASVILAPITYSLNVDLTVLNQTLSSNQNSYKRKKNLVGEFFESFFDQLSVVLPKNRNKRSSFSRYRQPTAASTYANAVSVAQRFLKSLKI